MYENSLLYFVLFEDCSTTCLYCKYLLLRALRLPLTSMTLRDKVRANEKY